MPVREPTTALLAHELRETLGRLVRRLRAEPGLSSGRMVVLGRLDREGPASISDPQASACARNRWHRPSMISRATGWSPGAPTRPTDAVAFIELTTSGHELLQTTPAQRETCLTKALEDELDANERALLHKALALLSRIADA